MTILGILDIRDWDTGAMLTMGGEITTYVVDGDTRQIYTVSIPYLDSGLTHLNKRVPLLFQNPEDVYQEYVVPSIIFKRNDLTPAFDRQPWYQYVARAPSPDATKVILSTGEVGYTKYMNQFRATPFDMSYEIVLAARRQQESVLMLNYALRRLTPPWFNFKVVDSLGDVRHYDAGDMTISNTSELADIADRTISWTISFTVRGELDLHDDMEYPAMIRPLSVTYAKYSIGQES